MGIRISQGFGLWGTPKTLKIGAFGADFCRRLRRRQACPPHPGPGARDPRGTQNAKRSTTNFARTPERHFFGTSDARSSQKSELPEMHPEGVTKPLHFFTSTPPFCTKWLGGACTLSRTPWAARPTPGHRPPSPLPGGGGRREGGRGEGEGAGAGRGESDAGPHPLRLPKDRPPHMNVWRPIG